MHHHPLSNDFERIARAGRGRESCRFVARYCSVILAMGLSLGLLGAQAQTVKVSAFGFDPMDATSFLQAALDSGAEKVIIDRQAMDWITRPLLITNSNVEVIVEDGVTLRAKRGEYKRRNDALLTIDGGASNVTVRGQGWAALQMNKRDYQDADLGYAHSEWRHAVSIRYARGVTVANLTIGSSGGDGVYVNGAKDVVLEGLRVYDHHRQGMSPIDVAGMTVRRCTFNETRGTPPQCGLDMEPNFAKNRFTDVVYEDCAFEGNASHGIELYLGSFTARTIPLSITFRRCISRDNGNHGVGILAGMPAKIVKEGPVGGFIRFEDCLIAHNGGGPVHIDNHVTNGLDISFANCRFDARGSRTESAVCLSNAQLMRDFGTVRFESCEALIDAKQKAVDFVAAAGIGIAGDVSGGLVVVRDGTWKNFDFAGFKARHAPHPEQIVHFLPAVVDFGSLAAPLGTVTGVFTPTLRWNCVYVQAVPKAGEYPIRFKASKMRKGIGPKVCAKVRIYDAAGTDLGAFDVPEGDSKHVLKAHGPGVFRLQMTMTGGNELVRIASATPGGALLCDQQSPGFFCGKRAKLYFRVPKGAKQVLVSMRPEEKVSAQLINASGRVVDDMPFQAAGKVLKATFDERTADEIWTLAFPKIEEDFRFQIGGDAVPLCSMEPGGVIAVK